MTDQVVHNLHHTAKRVWGPATAVLVVFSASASQPLIAGDWQVSKSASITAVHSDNISLASGANSETGSSFQVRPSLGISGKGSRMTLDMNYSLSALFADGRNSDDGIEDSHFLNANATIEAIENSLFLDVKANAGVTSVNRNNTAADLYNSSGNTTQTFSMSVSPFYRYHFGNYADLQLRYLSDTLANQDTSGNDSDQSSWSAVLVSGDHYKAVSWGVSASSKTLEYENGTEDESTLLNSEFQFRINRKFTADFALGYEENDFQTPVRAFSDTDGMTWDVGTTWTPNARTTLKLSYGDRFYGDNWFMDFKYNHKRSLLSASYTSTLSNSRSEQLGSLSELDLDESPLYSSERLDRTLPTLSTENIIQNRFKLAYKYSSRRTTIGLDTSYTERDYAAVTNSTETTSTSVSLSRKLSPVTSMNTRLSLVTDEGNSGAGNIDTETVTLRLGVSTKLGAKSKLSVDAQRSEKDDALNAANDYTENRLTASLSMTF